jgi:tetratricopeptide (TPR) repeat protein
MFGAWVDWPVIAGRDPDEVLLWGWIAEAAGLAAGNVDAANFAALLRAEQSLLLGEYDSALAALDRVRRRKPLGPSVELAIEVARLTGVIQVRRGRRDDALATWRQSLEQLTTSEVLAARVRWTIVTSLSYDPTFREALIEEADKLLAALRNGAVIEGTAGIPHVEELESAKLDLAKGKGRLPEFFDSSPADATSPALRQQAEIWQQLVQAEATGDQATILLCLRLLGQQLYEGQKARCARGSGDGAARCRRARGRSDGADRREVGARQCSRRSWRYGRGTTDSRGVERHPVIWAILLSTRGLPRCSSGSMPIRAATGHARRDRSH